VIDLLGQYDGAPLSAFLKARGAREGVAGGCRRQRWGWGGV